MGLTDVYAVARALGVAEGTTTLRPPGRGLFPLEAGPLELSFDQVTEMAAEIRAGRAPAAYPVAA